VFVEAAKILYKDYLNYKDRASRQNSVDHTSFQPYNANIRLPNPESVNIQNQDKRNKNCSC
jgi:hypothetical protein